MPHSLRKIRKFRGSRTHGWGQISQHRESGSHGGRGNVGGHKHNWTHTVKYQPNLFGKNGFRCPVSKEVTTINVGDLEQLIEKLPSNEKVTKDESSLSIDLSKLGFDKLLGRGKISKPVIVKIKKYSQSSLKKIEEVNGRIIQIK